MSLKLLDYRDIRGTLEVVESGLRIGGSQESVGVGETDLPVIKHPKTNAPYIPGSSLKGKIRSLLEHRYRWEVLEREERTGPGRRRAGDPCNCGQLTCPVCILFGPHQNLNHRLGPTRLLVRDAILYLNEGEAPEDYLEVKSETAVNRTTHMAAGGSLRQIERVVSGAVFTFSMSVRVFEGDDSLRFGEGKSLMDILREGFDLLEKDYLGGMGSRGYGKAKFTFEEPSAWRESGT